MNTKKWFAAGSTAVALAALAAFASVARASTVPPPGQGVEGTGHGFHSGDVRITTTRLADGSFALADPTRGDITLTDANRDDSFEDSGSVPVDPDNDWGNGQASDLMTGNVDAYFAAERTWDYFATVHGRRGPAGDGIGPRILANFADVATEDERSGQWRPACRCVMLSPPPPGGRTLNTLGVVAHEISHGLVSSTAGLDTRRGEKEPYALDEATGDIFGALVEFAANLPSDPPDYTVGEGALDKPARFMDDPTRDGVSAGCWKPGLSDDPRADPHALAGIVNKFFFQLAVGSGKSPWGDSPTCAGAPAVTGLGNDRAGRIWYATVTKHLVANSNFAGARRASVTAATDLFGPGSVEVATVEAAWRAVGVDGAGVVPEPPNGPKLARINPWAARVGRPAELFLNAPDPQRQKVTFTATGLPPGMTLDAGTGVISGTPTAEGSYPATFTATDPDGNRDTVALGEDRAWQVGPSGNGTSAGGGG